MNNQWDHKIIQNPDGGNLLQTLEFAKLKEQSGWKTYFLNLKSSSVLVLEKTIPLLGKLWYIPKGPGISSATQLKSILDEIKKEASKNGVFTIKLEPELEKTDENIAAFSSLGLMQVSGPQPTYSTVLLDLAPSIEEILKNLNQKGRHALRRAERDGVTIKKVDTTDENCQIFYELFAKTAAGQFTIRSRDYYRKFWQSFSDSGYGQMFFTYFEGVVIASAYAVTLGNKSYYKDGASVRERNVYGASHLLQWEVIRWAKSRGSKRHDLYGAPPSTELKNEQHPYYNIGRFKTSFNKEITDFIGCYELPIKPLQQKIWTKLIEKAIRRLYYKKYGESYY